MNEAHIGFVYQIKPLHFIFHHYVDCYNIDYIEVEE